MTIKKLKEMIANLPDDMRIYADDCEYEMFGEDASEFVCLATGFLEGEEKKCVFQTKNDIDVEEELSCMADIAIEENWSDQDYFMEASDRGFKPEDFIDKEWAKREFKQYGLI